MRCGAWPSVVAACTLVVACVDDQSPPRSTEPLYTIVFFDSGSARLSKRAEQQLTDFVSHPTGPVKAMAQAKVCVVGHSDNVGPEPASRDVAQKRADAVARYLVELGVARERIVTSSLGSARPLVVTPPQTAEISNRRVEIVVGSC